MGSLRCTAVSISAAVVSTTALLGCALISGAGDLTVGPADGDATGVLDEGGAALDGASASDGGATTFPDGGAGTTDGAAADAASPGDGGDGGTRLRDVTFEDGSLLGIHGGDSESGSPALGTGLNALSGKDSMTVGQGPSGIEVDFGPVTELYATALVRLDIVESTPQMILAFTPEAGGLSADLRIASSLNPSLELFVAGASVASGGALTLAATSRIGVHIRQDASSTFVEIWLADGSAAAFGLPVITATTPRFGRTTAVRMGILDSAGHNNGKAIFDDLLIDTAALPAP